MKDPRSNWVKTEIEVPVYIPTLNGNEIAETVMVKVEAYRDPQSEELYLDGHALAALDKVKARHMGLISPEEIQQLRKNLGVTQKEISELLQLGEKTWTRWESGRERPSRSLNLLLKALDDGKIDLCYLKCMQNSFTRIQPIQELAKEERSHKMTFESDLQDSLIEEVMNA